MSSCTHREGLVHARRPTRHPAAGTLSAMGKPQTFLVYDSETNAAELFEVDRL